MIHWDTQTIAAASMSGLLAAAAWSDISIREIPDWSWTAILAIGLYARLAGGIPLVSAATAVAVGLLALLIVLNIFGILGGGDVKLAAAVALGLSSIQILKFVEFTALFGGVLAVLYLAARHVRYKPKLAASKNLLARVLRVELHRIRRGAPLPYGVALAAAGIFVLAGG